MKTFKDQVAIITGAASGLGFAIASKLSQDGVKLALLDFNGEKLHQIASQMVTATQTYVLDITNEGQVQQTIAEISEYIGTEDILVNRSCITGATKLKTYHNFTEAL